MFNVFLILSFFFLSFSLVATFISDESLFASAILDQSMTKETTVVPVRTAGPMGNFKDANGFLYIQEEVMTYTSKGVCPAPFQASASCFLGISRGTPEEGAKKSSSVETHSAGSKIYNQETNIINTAISFRVNLSSSVFAGIPFVSSLVEFIQFFFRVWWVWTTFDYNFLQEPIWPDGPSLIYLRYLLSLVGIASNLTLIFVVLKGVR